MKRLLCFAVGFMFAGSVQAQLFKIENRQGAPDIVFDRLEDRINAELPNVDSGQEFLDASSDASAFSGRGSTIDYNSTPKFMSVHAALGGAVVSEEDFADAFSFSSNGDNASDISGTGVSVAIGVGLNLGFIGDRRETIKERTVKTEDDKIAVQKIKETSGFDWSKLTVYLRFMTLDRDFSDVATQTTQYGIAAKYQVLEGKVLGTSALAKWTGLEVSFGVDHSSYDLSTSYEIDETVSDSGFTGSYSGPLDLSSEIETTVVSTEVWSGLRLLHALGFYGGLGLDFVSGSAKAVAASRGDVTFSGGASGVGVFDLTEEGGPEGVHARLFLGTQIHVFPFKIFAQWNQAFSPKDLKGLTLGTRLVF